jgi:hypothetical protein
VGHNIFIVTIVIHSENHNILGRVIDDALPQCAATARAFPQVVLIFDIIGVPKDNLTNSSTQKSI